MDDGGDEKYGDDGGRDDGGGDDGGGDDGGDERLEAGYADKERVIIGLPSETEEFNQRLLGIISTYSSGDFDHRNNIVGLCEKIPDIREKNLEILILSLEALSDVQKIKVEILDELVERFRLKSNNVKAKTYDKNDIKIALIRYARLWLKVNATI